MKFNIRENSRLSQIFLFIFFIYIITPVYAENNKNTGKVIPISSKKESGHLKAIQRIHQIENLPKKSRDVKSNDKEYILQVQATLGDNRTVSGKLPLKAPQKLKIKHFMQKIQYEKEITLNQIKMIKIISWKGKLVGQKKQGDLYRFSPVIYRVYLTDDTVLETNGFNFQFLNQFPVFNSHGKVYLYSWWLDLKKKDDSWHTGLSGPTNNRIVCHKDVVQKITFLTAKKDSQSKTPKK